VDLLVFRLVSLIYIHFVAATVTKSHMDLHIFIINCAFLKRVSLSVTEDIKFRQYLKMICVQIVGWRADGELMESKWRANGECVKTFYFSVVFLFFSRFSFSFTDDIKCSVKG
jgi:hypothetical protein